jgi:ABC-2 type transport system permease protein
VGDLAHIYVRLVGARIRGDFQYRTSFALFVLGQFLISFIDFLAIAVIFGQIPQLAGWSLAEVAFLYGVSALAFTIADVFVSQVEGISVRIRDGSFDLFLIRPLGSLFQVVTDDFQLRRVGKLAQAVVVLAVALHQVGVDWNAGRVAMVVVMVLAGAVIYGAVWIVGASSTFWTIETGEVSNAFTYGGNFLTQYPLEIYATWLRRLLAYVVPLAFVNYFPALWVLDRPELLGAPPVVRFLSPVVAVASVLVAAVAWRVAVRHYRSTGS